MVIFQYNIYIFWDPSLNRVIAKPCYNEPCYKEVEMYYAVLFYYCLCLTSASFDALGWLAS